MILVDAFPASLCSTNSARIHYTFCMAKRLHILLDDEEYLEIKDIARLRRVTVEEWVRQALRKAIEDHRSTVDAKLRAIADASRHRFPTADIDEMLSEVEAGSGTP